MGLPKRRWLIALLVTVILLGRVILDLLDKKPGGGVVGLVIGWPYLWFKILPSFLLGTAAYAFQEALPRSRVLLAALAVAAVTASHINQHLANLLVAPTLAYAIFYIAFSSSIRQKQANPAAFTGCVPAIVVWTAVPDKMKGLCLSCRLPFRP